MGLDTFASRTPDDVSLTEDDERAFDEAGLQLCGGIYSGAESSFRGKVYADAVERVTSVNLYQEWIPPETVRLMAKAFEDCDPEAVERDLATSTREVTQTEIDYLRRFFQICAERGLGLIGWW
jgi:hypothetical protein